MLWYRLEIKTPKQPQKIAFDPKQPMPSFQNHWSSE